jgi:hypothetical protein
MMASKTSLSQLVVMAGFLCACTQQAAFSDSVYNELMKDCTETLRCKSDQLQFAAAEEIEKCIEQTGDMLNGASDNQQSMFMNKVTRCMQLQVCDYTSCTESDPTAGYAGAHQAQINYECMQTIACRIAAGMPQGQQAVAECAAQLGNTLNFATQQQQATFEAKALKCAMATGCAYTTCQ